MLRVEKNQVMRCARIPGQRRDKNNKAEKKPLIANITKETC